MQWRGAAAKGGILWFPLKTQFLLLDSDNLMFPPMINISYLAQSIFLCCPFITSYLSRSLFPNCQLINSLFQAWPGGWGDADIERGAWKWWSWSA